jgi:cephalosporin hydroxylase
MSQETSQAKKLYTRAEFEQLRRESAAAMVTDTPLIKDALDVKIRAGRYYWVHQTTWFGEPILQLPQDMFALQEIIFATRPRFIVELGVAWGGSLLFYSTLMEVLGGERVIGVDIYIPDDLRARLGSFGRLSERITLIERSSVDATTVQQVRAALGDSRECLIVLDSKHTHEHVLNELRLYSPLVGPGYYLVCSDTVIEHQPEPDYRQRPWGHGNNPQTALNEFLEENGRFVVDRPVSDKLLMTCIPGGYLRCVKD